MNDKKEFLEKLRAALTERDVADADIAPYIERFDRYFDRMASDPDKENADLLKDVETIADNIADQIAERYESMNALAERTMNLDRVRAEQENKPAVQNPVAKPEQKPSEQMSAEPKPIEQNQVKPKPADSKESEPRKIEPSEAPEADESESHTDELVFEPETTEYDSALIERSGSLSAITEPDKSQPDEYIDEEPSPNSRLFWILFAVSLPITLPLALAGLAVFVALWLGLIGVMLTAIAALVALSAAGTALALVGIIYGISQLFNEIPVGMYELGMGILIGGWVMFAGILLYNIAIRLVPWLIKLVGKLLALCAGQLKRLFLYLKKECARL